MDEYVSLKDLILRPFMNLIKNTRGFNEKVYAILAMFLECHF